MIGLDGCCRVAAMGESRCRAGEPAGEVNAAAAADSGVPLHPLHSFSNAQALADACGWQLVKGFLVLERTEAEAGTSFVALRHWWNATANGAWSDLTPPLGAPVDGADMRRLLVESTLGEKPLAPITSAKLDFVTKLAARAGYDRDGLPLPAASSVPTPATLQSQQLNVLNGAAPPHGSRGGRASSRRASRLIACSPRRCEVDSRAALASGKFYAE